MKKRSETVISNKAVKLFVFFSFFLLTFLFASKLNQAFAATYYVDVNTGDDSKDGLSTGNAWKTIGKVNGSMFNAGDQILFNRGEVWKEQLTVPSSGTVGNPVTFGAYGTGAKPIIDGADTITGWTSQSVTSDNLASNTEAFNLWNTVNTSVSSNVTTDPAGATTADAIIENTTNADHNIYETKPLTASTAYTFSVYLKAGSRSWGRVELVHYTSAFALIRDDWAFFNLTGDGTVGSVNTGVSAAIYKVPNSAWYRASITITTPNAGTGLANTVLQLTSNTGDLDFGHTGDGTSQALYLAWAKLEQNASATTYTLPGSYTAYYKALSTQANQVFENGNRYVNAGEYHHLSAGSFAWDTASSRLYIRTTGDNNPTGYTVTASQRDNGILSNKSYTAINDLEVRNTNQSGIYLTNGVVGTSIQTCLLDYNYKDGIEGWHDTNYVDGVTVNQDESAYNGRDGISLENFTRNWIITNNSVHNNGQSLDWDFTAGIKAGFTTSYNNYVAHNDVYQNGRNGSNQQIVYGTRGAGIWFDTTGDGNSFKYNHVHDNNFMGIYIEVTSNATAIYNIVYGNSGRSDSSGISVSGRSDSHAANNTVYNNTLYGNNYGLYIYGDATSNAITNTLVKNNIAVGNTIQLVAGSGGDNGTGGSGNVYAYNSFGPEASNFIEWGFGIYKSTYTAFDSSYGSSTNSVAGDPKFNNPASNDFRLTNTSPDINAGTNVGLTTDYAGNSVPQGSAPDIGAYEFLMPTTIVINTSAPSNPSSSGVTQSPNQHTGWAYVVNAGPHYIGTVDFIQGTNGAEDAYTLIDRFDSANDLYVRIVRATTDDLLSQKPPISFPWTQGINTAGEIYNFQAFSAFNGYPIVSFTKPVIIVVPYNPNKLYGHNPNTLKIAMYNTVKKRWQFLTSPTIVDTTLHFVASTVSQFSYFTVGYSR